MAYRVEVTARARRNLDRIYSFVQAEESDHAFAWFQGLAAAMQSLSDMPKRAPVTHEDTALRHLLYGNKPHAYRIIYHVEEEAQLVTIITIRHGVRAPLRKKPEPRT